MNRKLPWYPQITTAPMYSSCVVHPAKQSSFVRILLFLRKRLLSFTYMVNLYPYNISKTLKIQRFICPSDNRADELLTRSLPQRTCSNHLQICNLSYFLPNAESKKKIQRRNKTMFIWKQVLKMICFKIKKLQITFHTAYNHFHYILKRPNN